VREINEIRFAQNLSCLEIVSYFKKWNSRLPVMSRLG